MILEINEMFLFWSTVIGLKLYIIVKICRFALHYSIQRKRKLYDTQLLKNEIKQKLHKYQKEQADKMAQDKEHLASFYVKNVECDPWQHKATASVCKETHQSNPVKIRKYSPPRLENKPIPKFINPNDSFSSNQNVMSQTKVRVSRTAAVVDYENMLYISDSVGHVFQQIPFTEQDYAEAYEQAMAKSGNFHQREKCVKKTQSKNYKYPPEQSTKGGRVYDQNILEFK